MIASDEEHRFRALPDLWPGARTAGLEPRAGTVTGDGHAESDRRVERARLAEVGSTRLAQARAEPERERVEREIQESGTPLLILSPADQEEWAEIDVEPETALRVELRSEAVGVAQI